MDQVYPGVSRSRSRAPAGGALLRDRSTGRCVARRFEMQCGMPPQRTLPAGRSVTAGLRARPLHQVWLGNVNAARDLQGLLSVGVTLNFSDIKGTLWPHLKAANLPSNVSGEIFFNADQAFKHFAAEAQAIAASTPAPRD